MPTQPPSEEIRQMAEEIFEITKLSWLGSLTRKSEDEYDLSESEFLTIDILTKTDSMTVGELQRSIGVLPAQMSRIIRSLEAKVDQPLVACSLNPDDKRKIDVSLTDAGKQTRQAYQADKLGTTIAVLAELDEADRADFMRILRIMRKKLAQATMVEPE